MKTFLGRFLGVALLICAGSAGAEIRKIADLVFDGAFVQGGLVIGHAPPGSAIIHRERDLRLTKGGLFLLAFGRESQAQVRLVHVTSNGKKREVRLQIAPRQWEAQHIKGLPERKVSPVEEDLAQIKQDRKLLVEARKRNSVPAGFVSGFISPLQGQITGRFGTVRVLNGNPRQPHLGLDIAAPTGTPVSAVADGIVTLAEEDMFFTGKTLLIDHGHGLSSVYAHLDSIEVTLGQHVGKGAPVGTVGMTGRATGPHLHWGMTLFDTHFDPELLLSVSP